MEIRRGQFVQQIAPMDHQNMGGRTCTSSLERCQHSEKGDQTECGNYRGRFLLSTAGKIFARILLNRLSSHIIPEVVPDTQCGFLSNWSKVDMIFCLRQLQEIDRPRLTSVYCLCRHHEGIRHRWENWTVAVSEEICMPEKVTTMIESLHTGMLVNVMNGGRSRIHLL